MVFLAISVAVPTDALIGAVAYGFGLTSGWVFVIAAVPAAMAGWFISRGVNRAHVSS